MNIDKGADGETGRGRERSENKYRQTEGQADRQAMYIQTQRSTWMERQRRNEHRQGEGEGGE